MTLGTATLGWSPRWTRTRDLGSEAALIATALVGGAALCRMVAGGLSGGAAGPILVTAVAGCVVPGALLRRRVPAPLLAVTVGAVTVALVALWASVPGATRYGIPTATTLRVLRLDLRAARASLSSFGVPLHASPGVVVLGALLAGMAAVAARMTWGIPVGGLSAVRPRHLPAFALVPSTTFVVWSCVAEPSSGSAILVAALLAAGAATVALAEPVATVSLAEPVAAPDMVRSSGGHRGLRRRLGTAASVVLVVAAVAAAVVVGVTTGSPGSDASSASPGRTIVTANAPTGLLLASDVTGVERRDPSVVLFWARAPIPTYWQVGVLTEWRDGRWLPDQATLDALHGRAPAVATPGLPTPSSHTFDVTVTVADLSSRLLPVPPTTARVDVPGGAVVDAEGAVAPTPSALDERYGATAVVPPVISAGTVSSTTGLSAQQLDPYLLMPSVSPVVTELARQIASSATTPLAQAESLVDWLRSGSFRYTLAPPPPGPSSSPSADRLVTFLTVTRAGTCEAFAGAFAVMARSLGLPTRVAVGFTEGHSSHGVSTVRGADAHEWPEVYLGSALGWVSFEPTPQLPSGELSPPSVVGPTGIALPPTSPPTAVTVPPSTPVVPTSSPSTATLPRVAKGGAKLAPSPASTPAPWLWASVAAVVMIVVALGLVTRRRRRRRPRQATASQRVLWSYQQAEQELRRSGAARPGWRPPPAHARALLSTAQDVLAGTGGAPSSVAGDELLAALRDLVALAETLEHASYSGVQPTPDDVLQAEDAGMRIRRTLRRRSVRLLLKQVTVEELHREHAIRSW